METKQEQEQEHKQKQKQETSRRAEKGIKLFKRAP